MCGLVGVMDPYLGTPDIILMEQLLYADALRGMDSTGIAAFTKNFQTQDYGYSWIKDAVPAYDMFNTQLYNEWVTGALRGSTKVLMGHNRAATMGSITTRNSHPFVAGDIILCHNGTLRDWSNLPDGQNFDVDSEAIAHSINEIGVEDTVSRLDGAFALTWLDMSNLTFNMIRNTQRPLCLRTNDLDNRAVWASESEMLSWILKRKNLDYTFKNEWEVEPGMLFTFPLDQTKIADFSTEKLKLYIPKTTVSSNCNLPNGYRASRTYSSKGNGGSNPRKEAREQNKSESLEAYKLSREQRVRVCTVDFKPYVPDNPNSRGYIDAYLVKDPWLAVEIHGVDPKDYLENSVYEANPICISDDYGYDLLQCDKPVFIGMVDDENPWAHIDPTEDTTPPTQKGGTSMALQCIENEEPEEEEGGKEVRFVGPSGRPVTEGEMTALTRMGCCNCTRNIYEEEYDSISWTQQGLPICPKCEDEYATALTPGGRVH